MHYSGWNITISIGISRIDLVPDVVSRKKASQYRVALYHNWNPALPTAPRPHSRKEKVSAPLLRQSG